MWQHISEIDWSTWYPRQRATLMFVREARNVLLIHKKRGLGAGNINGPGGRLEPGETPHESSIRELQEELLITPAETALIGELFFQFTDGLSIHCSVFRALSYSGTPTETDEATPLWTPIDQIPYERMWEDDRYWLPLLLNEESFSGYFLFEKSAMLDHSLKSPSKLSDLTRIPMA